MSDRPEVTVREVTDRQRYEAVVDGQVAGFVTYDLDDTTIDFLHTQADDAFDGRGVGSALARGALEGARERGLRVVATCPFIRAYLARHPEYASVVEG